MGALQNRSGRQPNDPARPPRESCSGRLERAEIAWPYRTPLSSVKTDPAHLRRQGRSKLDAGLESSSWNAAGRLRSQVTPSGGRTARPSVVGIGRPTGKPCQLTRLPMPLASWSAPDSAAQANRNRFGLLTAVFKSCYTAARISNSASLKSLRHACAQYLS